MNVYLTTPTPTIPTPTANDSVPILFIRYFSVVLHPSSYVNIILHRRNSQPSYQPAHSNQTHMERRS
ncbi:hypothetical protein BDN70DRAFT_888484 [Pholiota conissans]|uniref:Uncharacterized protein n=1 Tax=Pholiota conissans TaxID=109636 RepID=A0A9P5YM20_9AGAR|nr:hypothetical protein BDN70DRAFT_888484 [Pholiota conissans]